MRLIAALLAASLAVPATGLAQLLPAGEFNARDGRPGPGKKWIVTDAQGQALAAAMNAIASRTPIAIDYDHQTLHVTKTGAKAPAAGWIQQVEWRAAEGLFAKVEWTAAARAHIDAGEYRYLSPVLFFDEDTGVVQQVAMASLVNLPGIVGMDPVVAALSAFGPGIEPATPASKGNSVDLLVALATMLGLAAGTDQNAVLAAVQSLKTKAEAPPPKAALPAALSTALGLAEGADEAAALSAITALKAPDASAASAVTAMQAMQVQIAALTAQINGEKLTATVDQALAAGKLLPAQKDWALELGKKDMAALNAYLATAVPVAGLQGQSGGKQIDAGNAGHTDATALSADLQRAFGLSAEQFAKGATQAAH